MVLRLLLKCMLPPMYIFNTFFLSVKSRKHGYLSFGVFN